jgi:two-component system nitrate/nitrite response regulator NarL
VKASSATLRRKGAVARTAPRDFSEPSAAICDSLPSRARIVLIDDNWDAISRLREIIEQAADLEVVAACRCAEGGMLAVRVYRPELVVLNVRLTDRDGFELIGDIIAVSEAKVILFTASLKEAEIANALRSGAKAVVFKHQSMSMLISCVRDVLAGEECSAIMDDTAAVEEATGAPVSPRAKALSPREREVAEWAAAGARNKEIAWRLGISEGTVKLHLLHAYKKLSVSNRVGLVLALRKIASDIFMSMTFVSLTFV